jgi:hypothetical protein
MRDISYHCCHTKAINITYSVCAPVALVMQYANCKRRIHDFRGKVVFRFALRLLSETFLIPRRIQRDRITDVHVKHRYTARS